MCIGVINCSRHIVDHIDVQRTIVAAVVGVSGNHRERLTDAVSTSAGWVAIGAVEGVAIADHPGAGVVTGDGQGVAEAGGFRLRKSSGNAVGDDANPAHSQVFQAVQGGHREGAGLSQRRPIVSATQRQVLLIDRNLPAIHLKPRQHHRVVIVMHLQHKVGGAGVAIGIRQGIGKGFSPITATI